MNLTPHPGTPTFFSPVEPRQLSLVFTAPVLYMPIYFYLAD